MLLYPQQLTSPQRWWLLALLAIWMLLLFGGFLLGKPDPARSRRMPLGTRLGSSFVLALAAWSWYVFGRESEVAAVARLLALGMSAGFAADVVMAGDGRRRKLAGILLFGFNHILYIAALLHFGQQAGLTAPLPRWAALVGWWLLGLALTYVVVLRGQRRSLIHGIAAPYGLLLATTAGLALGLALQAPPFVPLALGAGLFVLSDLILAAAVLFGNVRIPFVHDIVWLTYGPAQMLIVYSMSAVLAWTAA